MARLLAFLASTSAALLLGSLPQCALAVHEGGTTVVLSTFENGQGIGKPAISSAGQGIVRIVGDTVIAAPNIRLTLEAEVGGLTGPALAAHFHGPAWFGQEAPVIQPLSLGISGTYDVSPDVWSLMVAGRTYLNVHTAAYPGGEIRGHVCFSNCGFAVLFGTSVIPSQGGPVTTPSYAVAQVVFAPATRDVNLSFFKFYGDQQLAAVSVKAGAPAGQQGMTTFCSFLNPSSTTLVNQTCEAALPAAMFAGQLGGTQRGNWYVEATTAERAGGLVRGQVIMPGNLTYQSYWSASLAGANERPPTTSTSTGNSLVFGLAGNVTRDLPSRFVSFLSFTSLSARQVAAHIHAPAGPDQVAAVQVPFPANGPFAYFAFTSSPLVTNSIQDGVSYVNVHSTQYPAGEIRGQLGAQQWSGHSD